MAETVKAPVEQLQMAKQLSTTAPDPAAPVLTQKPQNQTYAEKVQGLTVEERKWMLSKSKASAYLWRRQKLWRYLGYPAI